MSDRLSHLLEDLSDPENDADAGARTEEAALALLDEAATSDQAAYDTVRRLHGLLLPERTRAIGLALARELRRLTRGRSAGLRVESLEITIGIARHNLEIVLIPSVFEPEEWGTTFLEGLLRKPADEYRDRVLVELGCGSGWISIALGKFTDLRLIHGLDINPHAPLVSEVNAILNSYDERGAPLFDTERRLLYEKTSFRASDLLQVLREGGVRADYVIGSIPQVPKPDLGPVTPEADARRLYDLSNYCELQGVAEDRHGLGLIARALDQAIACLEHEGRVVFNLAGRPGTRVIERMFTKRGYVPRVLWRSRTAQAADTDIAELAELERRTGEDFQFYQHRASTEPISARTAVSWRKAGGELWHELSVYEATLRHPRERIALDAMLERMGLSELGRDIDLSAANAGQLAFALKLAKTLHRRGRLPYVHEQGSPAFREELAAYFEKFWGLGVTAEDLFIGPTVQATVSALLQTLTDPGDSILLSKNLAEPYLPVARRAGVQPLVGNNALDELLELARGLSPKVVLVRADEAERRNVQALEGLLALPVPVIFDESSRLRLAPELYKNEVLELLAVRPRGSTCVIAALREPAVYPELELALALAPPEVARRLGSAGEAAYCRISFLAELYFQHLLEQALAFHIQLGRAANDAEAGTVPRAAPRLPSTPPLSARIARLAEMPAFADEGPRENERDLIRLDYGENEYPVPRRLVAGLLAGLLEPPQPPLPGALRHAAAAYLRETRQGHYAAEEIAIGAGALPLLTDFIAALGKRLGRRPRVVLPRGYYGVFPGVLTLGGADYAIAETEAENAFKLAAEQVGDADVALLTHPGNPTGAYYTERELRALAAKTPYLVVDEMYGLLDSSEPEVPFFSAAALGAKNVLVLCGLSKEFAAGGLRIGFAAGRDRALIAAIESEALVFADRFAMRAAEHLLSVYRRDEAGISVDPRARAEIDGYLLGLRRHLAAQRRKLADALATLGIAVTPGAGLFLFPRVGDDERFCRALRERARLLANRGAWAGVPGHVRLVYSIDARRADEAADRLRRLQGRLA